MAKHLHLTIAEPCHEDWNNMTGNEKGKFCGSCQKQVIDFTGMTDAQLIAFFKRQSTGSVCGRLYDDQLDKPIPVPRKRIPWIKYFFQFSLPLFLTSLKLNAQKNKDVAYTVQQKESTSIIVLGGISRTDNLVHVAVNRNILIKGTIVNEEGQPVSYANIERGLSRAVSDQNGVFSMEIPRDTKEMKLRISRVGFEEKEIPVTEKQILSEGIINIVLKVIELKNLVISSTNQFESVLCGRVGGISFDWDPKPTLKVLDVPEDISTFKIYANPAIAGTAIRIDPMETEQGIYSVQLFDFSGNLIKQQRTRIEKGMGSFIFSIPSTVKGTYLVTLLNKKTGKKATEKLIVQ